MRFTHQGFSLQPLSRRNPVYLAGGSAGIRPVIGGLLIVTLLLVITLLRLIIALLLLLRLLISPLGLRLIGGLGLPVGCSG